jgi:hypothetical protein
MNAPAIPHCALGRLVPVPAINEAELFLMRRRAWREQGIVILAAHSIDDPWLRQAITNEANRLYGHTMARTR